jgi:hypothetical protein
LDELCLPELVEYFLINEAMISRKLGLLFYHNLTSYPMTRFEFRQPNLRFSGHENMSTLGDAGCPEAWSPLRPTGLRTEFMQAKGLKAAQCHAKTSGLAKISIDSSKFLQ